MANTEKLRNRIVIVLNEKNWVILRVKDEAEAKEIITRLSNHDGRLLLKTSMESCPVIIHTGQITKAIYLEGEITADTVEDVL
jgi:hypothetical protein